MLLLFLFSENLNTKQMIELFEYFKNKFEIIDSLKLKK